MDHRVRRIDGFTSALRRLKEMECWNTAEVVVQWAWAGGSLGVTDHNVWKDIEHETLEFYRTRGVDRLGSLSRHIKESTYGSVGDQNTPCKVTGVRRPVHLHVGREGISGTSGVGMRKISKACQLKRLYQLFELDPTTWEQVIAAGKSDEKPSGGGNLGGEGQSMPPVQFLYSMCDYP